jgi:hypothetical protein
MPTTGIQRVYSDSKDHYMFVKLEDKGNNRYIEEDKDVGDCHVPWCSSTGDLLKKGIVIINRTKATLVGYVWQDKDKDGDDRVRFAKQGWEVAAQSNRLPGFSKVGTKINLKIDGKDNVSAEEASPT